jgi:hypothetical protein
MGRLGAAGRKIRLGRPGLLAALFGARRAPLCGPACATRTCLACGDVGTLGAVRQSSMALLLAGNGLIGFALLAQPLARRRGRVERRRRRGTLAAGHRRRRRRLTLAAGGTGSGNGWIRMGGALGYQRLAHQFELAHMEYRYLALLDPISCRHQPMVFNRRLSECRIQRAYAPGRGLVG